MRDLNWAAEEIALAIAAEVGSRDTKDEEIYNGAVTGVFTDALSVYKNIMDMAEHCESEENWNILSKLLYRLMRGLPLTPVTAKDDEWVQLTEKYYRNRRLTSLYKLIRDGQVLYADVDRIDVVDIHHPERVFGWGFVERIIDEQYPIRFPYYPEVRKFRAFVETSGDNDKIVGIMYVRTPGGVLDDVKRFFYKESIDGDYIEISYEDYCEKMGVESRDEF